MGAAKSDNAHRLAAPGLDDGVRKSADPPERDKSALAVFEADIFNHRSLNIEPGKVRQRQPMLG